MNLKPNDFYDCYAEKAEFHEGKKGGLFIKMTYRFPKTGDTLPYYHMLIDSEGKARTFPVDRKNPDGPKTTEQAVLEERYGVDLSNFEFDQNALKPDIIVRAFIEEEVGEWNGTPYKRPRIRRIYASRQRDDNSKAPPPNKDDLRRRFGSALRAGHATAKTPVVSAPNATPPQADKPPTPAKEPAGRTSTAEECWNEFCRLPAYKDADEGTRTDKWFELLQSVVGHVMQERVTPQEWGRMMDKIGEMDDVPF